MNRVFWTIVWFFTEENPWRELDVAKDLATGARVLKGFNDTLSAQSISAAEAIYALVDADKNQRVAGAKVKAAVELLITTGNKKISGRHSEIHQS